MGNNSDPITLHKYLYANADPGNMVDPSGNFSIGSTMSAINTMATLAARAQTAITVFNLATGEEEFSARTAGTALILRYLPIKTATKILNKIRKRKSRGSSTPDCNSFTSDTLIYTQRGLIPISKVVIGDYVLSWNEGANSVSYEEVVHLISHDKNDVLVVIEMDNGEVIESTEIHPFYVDNQWIDAEHLKAGDVLTLVDGQAKVANISTKNSTEKVHNFTVANTHTYFVGKDGVLVHNRNISCDILLTNVRLSGTSKNAKWAKSQQGALGPGLRDHFDKHGRQVGARNAKQYDLSARITIKHGRQFKYRDPTTNEPRVGYWDPATGHFTATSPKGKTTILTHFPVDWAKIKSWPGFSN
jgi:hypothetical protein